jgi:hypothetical protein
MSRGKPFAKGFDVRRKLLTHEDRARGYRNAPSKVRARIRGLYKGGKIKKTGETVYREYESLED